MLDISTIPGLNPYYKSISILGIKKVSAAFEMGRYGENLNQMNSQTSVKLKNEYVLSEGEKTDFDKYVGTIIDEAA